VLGHGDVDPLRGKWRKPYAVYGAELGGVPAPALGARHHVHALRHCERLAVAGGKRQVFYFPPDVTVLLNFSFLFFLHFF